MMRSSGSKQNWSSGTKHIFFHLGWMMLFPLSAWEAVEVIPSDEECIPQKKKLIECEDYREATTLTDTFCCYFGIFLISHFCVKIFGGFGPPKTNNSSNLQTKKKEKNQTLITLKVLGGGAYPPDPPPCVRPCCRLGGLHEDHLSYLSLCQAVLMELSSKEGYNSLGMKIIQEKEKRKQERSSIIDYMC